jgi:hypothetical protein
MSNQMSNASQILKENVNPIYKNLYLYVPRASLRTTEDQVNQMMLERHQMLAESLERAEAGRATEDDWNIIRFECGAPKRPAVILKTISIKE